MPIPLIKILKHYTPSEIECGTNFNDIVRDLWSTMKKKSIITKLVPYNTGKKCHTSGQCIDWTYGTWQHVVSMACVSEFLKVVSKVHDLPN